MVENLNFKSQRVYVELEFWISLSIFGGLFLSLQSPSWDLIEWNCWAVWSSMFPGQKHTRCTSPTRSLEIHFSLWKPKQDWMERKGCEFDWPVIGPNDRLGSPDWGIVWVVGQLPAELPQSIPVTVQLVCWGVVTPGAGEERPLELNRNNQYRAGEPRLVWLTLLLFPQGAARGGALYLLTTVLMVSTQVSSSFWSEVWNKYSALSEVLSRKTNCFLV